MKFPKMNRSRPVSVTVPQLNGGINLQDSPSMVNDNQLTAAKNMWYHNGCLRTRPGIVDAEQENVINPQGTVRYQPTNEREAVVYGGTPESDFVAYHIEANGKTTKIAEGLNIGVGTLHRALLFKSTGNDNDWYGMIDNGSVIKMNPTEIVTAEPYIPAVMINGYGVGADGGDNAEANAAYEDYNMLTRAFTCKYTTDGHCSEWKLPMENLGRSEDGRTYLKVEITHSLNDGKSLLKRTYTLDYDEFEGDKNSVTGMFENNSLIIALDRERGIVKITKFTKDVMLDENEDKLRRSINNNLVITAWRGEDWDSERTELCQMTQCTWFGGERSGLSAGNRLFVTGNQNKPNILRWSAPNNPLFFPEHNYAYIGDANEKIQGLGKQGNLLIIFKEHSIYTMQYVAGDDDDYSFAKESGVPFDTYTAKFPVTPISHTIGCDLPGSIRLVNNRLVWATKSGYVYMLTGVNQYSEQNIRVLSDNLDTLLKQDLSENGSENAVSAAELDGYYVLLNGGKAYLLDTKNSAFQSYTYYSNEEKARKSLPWYVWDLSTDGEQTSVGLLSDENGMCIIQGEKSNEHITNVSVKRISQDTMATDAPCFFTTKLFDFGCPDIRKAVEQMYLDMADIAGGEVSVSYVTERGTVEDAQVIRTRGDAQERDPGYMRTVRLTPGVHRCRLFGLRLSSEGSMAVENILIKMRRQGVVR